MSNEETEAGAVMPVTTASGVVYDMNNIPGRLKVELVASGELQSSFVPPANMPGNKLAAMRAVHDAQINAAIKAASKDKNQTVEFTVGMLVRYNKDVVEVQKVGKDEEDKKRAEQVLVPKREGGTIWVHVSKVEVLTDEELKAIEEA